MDLERASLKALFYDYPIEYLVKLILSSTKLVLQKPFVGLVQWREMVFTQSELEVWSDGLFASHNETEGLEDKILHVLNLLNRYAQGVLSYEHERAYVDFKHLFRWRELSLCIGEDSLIIPFLAIQDNLRDVDRNYFTWSDILPHNNHKINSLFGEGLSELHTHLSASGNIVDINWICLMNRLDNLSSFSKDITSLQDVPILLYQNDFLYPLKNLCILAAFIRVKLFQFLFIKDYSVSPKELCKVLRNLEDDIFINKIKEETNKDISICGSNSLKTVFFEWADYAIRDQKYPESELLSPYMLLSGERRLIYYYFLQLHKHPEKVKWFAPYVYLYLLIKIRFRKEFIQTNQLIGFKNFTNYQKRKKAALGKKDELYSKLFYIFALQSCLRSNKDCLEIRVSSDMLSDLTKFSFNSSVFQPGKIFLENVKIDVVVHFLKGKSRSSYKEELNEVLKKRDLLHNTPFTLVGLDAAGSEFKSRPEDFGQIFRYAKLMKLERATFHAGEDFYDIADGLRTMDEAVLFLQLSHGDRLGHGLALGVNAEAFYDSRHSTVAIPDLVLLDNLVWIHFKAQQYNITIEPSICMFIEEQCFELYHRIYKKSNFDFFHYWNSMLLRSNDFEDKDFTRWQQVAKCDHPRCHLAAKDSIAYELLKQYREYKIQYNNHSCKFPKGYAKLIYAIQKAIQADLADKGIAIECNPSSNLKIGRFHKYEEHPIFQFCSPDEKDSDSSSLQVSVNTDDRGVFSTSLMNEYSLLALALSKQRTNEGKRRWSDECICSYLTKLINNGKEQRFSKINESLET